MEDLRLEFAQALQALNWTSIRPTDFARAWQTGKSCLLESVFASGLLSPQGQRRIRGLRSCGIELQLDWRSGRRAIECEWIGRRLCLGSAVNLSARNRLATIVSSAIGRHGQRLPDWPRLLDSALRSMTRSNHKLLIVQGTTLSNSTAHFARQAGVEQVTLQLPGQGSVVDWLIHVLLRATSEESHKLRHFALLSPALGNVGHAPGPTQDRLAIALADTVYALSVRPQGNIHRLLDRRLRDPRFPLGSVFVAMPTRSASKTLTRKHAEVWLDRGAVGWFVPVESAIARCEPLHCRRLAHPATQQICSPIPSRWRTAQQQDWRWLVHCTRGSSGPLPEESDLSFQQRVWLQGRAVESHPMLTLMRICSEGILKGTSRITRTDQRCVSFSAVHALELINRRQFRSHLGRWDWEPYGLIFSREVLQNVGARPVIYGSEVECAGLQHEQLLFFQPLGNSAGVGKSRKDTPAGWSTEQEWRLPGDLDLRRLAQGGVSLFTRTQTEAMQLSRHCNWPVFWIS